jgi:hypothetical protein
MGLAGHYTGGVRRLLAWSVLLGTGGVAAAEPAVPASRRLSPRVDGVLVSYSATRNDSLTSTDLRLKAGAPIVRGDGFGIALLAGYDGTHIDVAMADGEHHLSLHRLDATLAGGAGLAPDWSMRGSFGTAYSSDFRVGSWRAVQVTSSAMLHHVLGPSDGVVFGVVYTSTGELFPVLPIAGYVHQVEGSPVRIDVFLPRHARVEYELGPRLRGALGVEVNGNTWILQAAPLAKRAGGALFAELEIFATQRVRLEARAGMSVDRYRLPATMDTAYEQGLRAAAFAQLAVVIVP